MPSVPTLTLFVNGIDGKSVGNTVIDTVPAGNAWSPLAIYVFASNVTGVTVPATISIGIAGPNYTEWLAATALWATGVGNVSRVLVPASDAQLAGATTDIVVRVSTAATATTYTFDVFTHVLTVA